MYVCMYVCMHANGFDTFKWARLGLTLLSNSTTSAQQ